MKHVLKFTDDALEQFSNLKSSPSKTIVLKAVRKALAYLESNPRHPGLNSHKYDSLHGENGEDVFEVYAQNKTPGAYRVFWHYGPGKGNITIIAITPHPEFFRKKPTKPPSKFYRGDTLEA